MSTSGEPIPGEENQQIPPRFKFPERDIKGLKVKEVGPEYVSVSYTDILYNNIDYVFDSNGDIIDKRSFFPPDLPDNATITLHVNDRDKETEYNCYPQGLWMNISYYASLRYGDNGFEHAVLSDVFSDDTLDPDSPPDPCPRVSIRVNPDTNKIDFEPDFPDPLVPDSKKWLIVGDGNEYRYIYKGDHSLRYVIKWDANDTGFELSQTKVTDKQEITRTLTGPRFIDYEKLEAKALGPVSVTDQETKDTRFPWREIERDLNVQFEHSYHTKNEKTT